MNAGWVRPPTHVRPAVADGHAMRIPWKRLALMSVIAIAFALLQIAVVTSTVS